MQISRRKTTIAFVLLGALGVGLAIALNITWAFHWRSVAAVVAGIILFGILIAALTLNTIFLVREIRRSEQHDSFINAVTHELKTPIASIKLYLETLQSRPVEDEQRQEFYRVMLEDVGRLLGTVEQVLKAGQVVQSRPVRRIRVDVNEVLTQCVELARKRHYLPDGQMSLKPMPAANPPVCWATPKNCASLFPTCSTMPSSTRPATSIFAPSSSKTAAICWCASATMASAFRLRS